MIGPMRHKFSLTGRMRMRAGWFGMLIPQVEVCEERFRWCQPPPGRKNDDEWQDFLRQSTAYWWRDAKWEDLCQRDFTMGERRRGPRCPDCDGCRGGAECCRLRED